MNKFITKPVIGFVLLIGLFIPQAHSQSQVSGRVFNDLNHNGIYDPNEGLVSVTVWLLDGAAVSPFYKIYPVQTAITSMTGDYSFANVPNGNYQVKIKMATLNNIAYTDPTFHRVNRIVGENNPYVSDNELDGSTTLAINAPGTYSNIDFGFAADIAAPVFTPQKRFAFDTNNNSFTNVMSKTFDLSPEDCGGISYNPTITFTTDRQCVISSQLYPQAGDIAGKNGLDWPGPNKGGFYSDDVTLQMEFGQACYNPVSNDRATLTVTFSNPVNDVRFSIYDIDGSNPQLVDGTVDHVKVTGYINNNVVMPTIILSQPNPYNSVSGNNISGWADYPDNNPFNNFPDSYNSGDGDNGNANVYFDAVIDRIVIEYEESAPVLINSAKKIQVPVTPVDNESQWGAPKTPSARAISIGSIGYSFLCNILAADQLSFDAKASGQKANLQWSKPSEQDLKQYRIEHLTSNGNWVALGNISVAGAGHVYHFADLHPAKGVNQYRLALLNLNGTSHLSEVRKVSIAATDDIEIINNPAPSLNLVIYGKAKDIAVFDGAGLRIFDYPVTNTSNPVTTIKLDHFALHTGFYFVKALFASGEVKTLKFVKN